MGHAWRGPATDRKALEERAPGKTGGYEPRGVRSAEMRDR